MPTGPNTSCKGRYFTNNAYLSPIPLNFNSTSGIGWYFHLQPTIDQPLANQSQPTIKIRQPTIGWLITGLRGRLRFRMVSRLQEARPHQVREPDATGILRRGSRRAEVRNSADTLRAVSTHTGANNSGEEPIGEQDTPK
jgi:hypothetical protein